MKAFGVGCLNFSFKEGITREITVQEYIDEVKNSLEKLSTVSDVEIFFDYDVGNEKIQTCESTKMKNGEPCHPLIPLYKLSFNLYLPKRVQGELIGKERDNIDTDSDNFKILFIHDWHGPFTIVESIGAGRSSSPSTAIQVVREYLKKEIGLVSSILQLDYIGPSPFHADFFFSESSQENIDEFKVFELNHTKVPGYDDLSFSYSKNVFESEDIAFDEFVFELSSEVGFYYELEAMNRKRFLDLCVIQDKLHDIMRLEDDGYKKTLKDRMSYKPKLLSGLYRDIGLYKGQEIQFKNTCQQHYSSIYKSGKYSNYLMHFVDDLINNWPSYPIAETAEIISYFESKSSKSMELVIIFLASVFGGAVGAGITVIFGS